MRGMESMEVSSLTRVLFKEVEAERERSTWPDCAWLKARIIMGVFEIMVTMVTVEIIRMKMVVRDRQIIRRED